MATANLPAISHPLSRLSNPEKIEVRGLSRGEGASSRIQDELQKVSQLRPITADQIPWRLTKSSCGSRGFPKDTSLPALAPVHEGVQMKRAGDQSKPTIPIFGQSMDNCISFKFGDPKYGQTHDVFISRLRKPC